jgi:deazaflavin-dependent oxidoreductase (nitroreductase family)
MSAYKQFWRRLGHARWFAFAVRYALAGVDRRLYRLSRGRVSVAGPPLFSWMLLTTTGRRSGQPRTTPLIYIRDGDRLVVTSENFGMAERPAGWRLNLQANPDVTVEIGGTVGRYRGRLADEDEIARYWPQLLEQWPALETYRRRSGVRYVFVLAPSADATAAR